MLEVWNKADLLALAFNLDIRASGLVPVPRPKPATLFGAGKVEELEGLIRGEEAELVIVDNDCPEHCEARVGIWAATAMNRATSPMSLLVRTTRPGTLHRMQTE